MNNLDKTLVYLHDMLKMTEASMKKTPRYNPKALIQAIDHGNTKRKSVSHPKGKGNAKVRQSNQGSNTKVEAYIIPTIYLKQVVRFYCQTKDHQKCSCSK